MYESVQQRRKSSNARCASTCCSFHGVTTNAMFNMILMVTSALTLLLSCITAPQNILLSTNVIYAVDAFLQPSSFPLIQQRQMPYKKGEISTTTITDTATKSCTSATTSRCTRKVGKALQIYATTTKNVVTQPSSVETVQDDDNDENTTDTADVLSRQQELEQQHVSTIRLTSEEVKLRMDKQLERLKLKDRMSPKLSKEVRVLLC
jgi:hypothetical protein